MVRDIIIIVLMTGGFFFLTVGVLGLLRLPDVYTRMHAVGKCDTLGADLMLLGLILLMGGVTESIKLVMIMGLVFIINPVVTHLMAKTAYERGMELIEGSYVLNTYFVAANTPAQGKEEEGA